MTQIPLVRHATQSDLDFIEHLRRKEAEAISFIPRDRYQAELDGRRNGRLYIVEENADPVGFAFCTFGDIGHVQQIAIREDARRAERGAALIAAFEAETARRGLTQAGCRVADELEATAFWNALGFEWVRRLFPNNVRKRSISFYRKPIGTGYLLVPDFPPCPRCGQKHDRSPLSCPKAGDWGYA